MRFSIIALFSMLCCSCQPELPKEAKSDLSTKEKMNAGLIDKKIDSLYNAGVFNGFSTTIVDTSGILYNKGFGYADVDNKRKYTENTIINIASVSKVFISVALLKAQEMGLMNLDDPINAHLPFKVMNPHFPQEVITLRQLATHTSSIVDNDVYLETCYVTDEVDALSDNLKEKYGAYYQNPQENWLSLKDYLGHVLLEEGRFYETSTFAERKPGAIYEYSNIGAALCALAVESAAKKPFHQFTEEQIFEPLGMTATSWLMEEVNAANYSVLYADDQKLPYYTILSYPDGGLISSGTDLGHFLVELMKGYSGNGLILDADSYAELFKPQLAEKAFAEQGNRNEGNNTGLFLRLEPAYNEIGHTGGDPGVNSFMFFNTETKRGKILITNTDSEKDNSRDVFYGIWKALDGY